MLIATLVLFVGLSASAATEPPAKVLIKPIQKEEISESLTYPARILSKVNTAVFAEIDGVVAKVSTSLGKAVKRGQKVIVIRHTDPVYKYAPFLVEAPVNGVISSIEVTEGYQVARGQRLASITDPSKTVVKLEIPVADLASLKEGMSGEWKSSAGESVSVVIDGISPYVDPATGTVSADLKITGARKVIPGTLGAVTFRVNTRSGFNIPESAIVYKGDNTFVRVLENGISRQIPVKLGRKERGSVETLSLDVPTIGPSILLPEKPVLIMRASRFINDGEKVEIQEGT